MLESMVFIEIHATKSRLEKSRCQQSGMKNSAQLATILIGLDETIEKKFTLKFIPRSD